MQHALRAYTPKEQKAVRAAAESFRTNPDFSTEQVISELKTGEALVSFIQEDGSPAVVQRARILFPLSQIGAITEGQRDAIIKRSRIYGKYDKVIDRESAFEVLLADKEKAEEIQAKQAKEVEKAAKKSKKADADEAPAAKKKTSSKAKKTIAGAAAGAIVTSVTRSIGNEISKSITGKKRSSTKDIAGKAISAGATTALRQITRSILGNLIK